MSDPRAKSPRASNHSAPQADLHRYILDKLTDFITLCDADFIITESNRPAEIILNGGAPLKGSHCYQKYRGRETICEDCPLEETLSSGEIVPVEYYDTRFEAYFEERLYPILGENGTLNGFVLVGRNVTRTREMSDKSVQNKKLAALGQISSGVAHDFNNVLTGILGRLQLLKKLTGDAELLKNFAVMETAALDGAATVKRMQDFARVREGTDFESVNMHSLLEEVVILTRPRWRDGSRMQGILVEINLELAEEVYILGAAYDLRRAFTNLIFNSVDALPDGGVITIHSEVQNSSLVISVQDTGLGMTEETTERVFDPFFSTKGVKGTGLGLSEVYGVCKRHNGSIEVASEVGKGTTFTLTFPIAEKGIIRPPVLRSVLEKKPSRILVIDDEKYVLDIIQEVLAECNHQVVPFSSAQEALNELKHSQFDIVITDLGMPEMSGWEVARYVKIDHPELPVILLTGWALEMEIEGIRDNGVDFVLQKPFSMEDLEHAVASVSQTKIIPLPKSRKK